MRLALAFVLVACGGATPKESTLDKAQQEKLCRGSADHLVLLITGDQTGGVPTADRLRTGLLEQCVTRKWSIEAMDCFTILETIDKADTCAPYLTVPQRDGFQQAIETAVR
ncbi:MAG: hypothetical protein H0T89_02695 [Deltaproteobacteria bacterium]|nr:hypothetical protein [Deltaproteobacteria bacterium]MDQ3298759.1 hypothetical protein [Myxococcota bacterium]